MNKMPKEIYTGKFMSKPQKKRNELFRELVQISPNEYKLEMRANIQSVEICKSDEESTLIVEMSRAGNIYEASILLSHLKRLLPGLTQIKLKKEALIFVCN